MVVTGSRHRANVVADGTSVRVTVGSICTLTQLRAKLSEPGVTAICTFVHAVDDVVEPFVPAGAGVLEDFVLENLETGLHVH